MLGYTIRKFKTQVVVRQLLRKIYDTVAHERSIYVFYDKWHGFGCHQICVVF